MTNIHAEWRAAPLPRFFGNRSEAGSVAAPAFKWREAES
jgi:hypothetical protein